MQEKTAFKLAKRAIKNKTKAAKKGFIIFDENTVYIPVKNDYPYRVKFHKHWTDVDKVPFIGY